MAWIVGDLVECQEPNAGDDGSGVLVHLVWLGVVMVDQTEPHVRNVAFCQYLGIASEASEV
jgi:hypothetical protein